MKLLKNDKWTLYLYYRGIRIKKLKIDKNEAPADNVYIVNVYFKKQLFGSNFVNIAVRPTYILHNDDLKQKSYWEVIFEEGIKI